MPSLSSTTRSSGRALLGIEAPRKIAMRSASASRHHETPKPAYRYTPVGGALPAPEPDVVSVQARPWSPAKDQRPETRDQRPETRLGSQRAAVDVAGATAAGVEAANAETAAMSCTDMLVTTPFISSAHGPRRAPVFMSKSCRIV